MGVDVGLLPARAVCEELLANQQRRREAEARELALVADLIDLYDTVDGLELPGSERLVPAGGDGTPEVAEFLPLELGPLLETSRVSAWALVRDVANLRARHPRLWEAVHGLVVPVWQARQIAQQAATAHLSLAAALWVDQRLAPAVGRLPWPRLRRKLAGLIASADTALAARLAQERSVDRFVHIRHDGNGMASVFARLTSPEALRLRDAIDALTGAAIADGHTGTPDGLAADALVELATPSDRAGLPRSQATLVVHVARETLDAGAGVARPEHPELGPLLLAQVVDLLGHSRVRLLPVLDLEGDPHVDSYEIPDRIRDQVTIREPVSVFPFSPTASRSCDQDHSYPYALDGPPGQTRPSNLGPEARTEHRGKTHGGWEVDQCQPGEYLWTSPLGYCYLVNRHGTHRTLNLDDPAVYADVIDELTHGKGPESLSRRDI